MLKIEHIGIAVSNLEASNKLFSSLLGTDCYKTEEVESEGVTTSFFKVGESKIELLEATDSNSAIAKFIEKKGEGIHHIAFATENIDNVFKEVEAKGIQLIDKTPRKGAEGLDIAFLHPKSTLGVLTELCENKKTI